MITLFPEQQSAVDAILIWSTSTSSEFKLGGYAGTGKTTVIKTIAEALKDKFSVSIAAFTGKAVSVLRRKGCSAATTIHSLLYTPYMNKGKLCFELVEELPCDLLIVDEASMISEELYTDLMSFGIKVLWVGDPGQLEPVGNDINLMKTCDRILETIHRQGEGSQILDFASAMRHGRDPRDFRDEYSNETEVTLVPKNQMGSVECDQFICGFNKTRVIINNQMRSQLGNLRRKLNISERMIILKNEDSLGVFNGMHLTLTKITEENSEVTRIEALDDLGSKIGPIDLYIPQLGQIKLTDPNELRTKCKLHNRNLVLADYGYCITGHKSQGSEWPVVAVIEEIWKEKWTSSRWRYTTATRASKKLLYFF